MAFDWNHAASLIDANTSLFVFLAALNKSGEVELFEDHVDGDAGKFRIQSNGQEKIIQVAGDERKWFDFASLSGGMGACVLARHALGWSRADAAKWMVYHVSECPTVVELTEAYGLGLSRREREELLQMDARSLPGSRRSSL